MTITQLVAFLAVVDTGRFTQAASLVGIAQPTLSKQVRSLETTLGETLFTRGSDGVRLTPAGHALLPRARRIVADSETAHLEIAELAGLQRGRLRVGATPSLCVSLVADSLALFHQRHPGVALRLVEGGSQDLVRELDRGQLDLALVIASHAAEPDPATHDLDLTPVLAEELVAAVPVHGPVGADLGDDADITELARHPLVLTRPGYDLREITLAACARAGVTPTVAVEGGEMDALLRMVERGLGVAVVPSIVLARARPELRAVRLDGSGWARRTIALARRTDVAPTRAAAAFRDTLLSSLTEADHGGTLPAGVRAIHAHSTGEPAPEAHSTGEPAPEGSSAEGDGQGRAQ